MQVFKLQNKTGAAWFWFFGPPMGISQMKRNWKARHACTQRISIFNRAVALTIISSESENEWPSCNLYVEVEASELKLLLFFWMFGCTQSRNANRKEGKITKLVGFVAEIKGFFFFPTCKTTTNFQRRSCYIVLAVRDPNLVGLVDRSKSNTVVIVWCFVVFVRKVEVLLLIY